jgi:hypothetical protein
VNDEEVALWKSARTLADLGELTARALEGHLPGSPWHLGPPQEETTSLTPVLVRMNRAGFVTENSQPGAMLGDGFAQRAFVSGFVTLDLGYRLRAAMAPHAEILVTLNPGRHSADDARDGPDRRLSCALGRREL